MFEIEFLEEDCFEEEEEEEDDERGDEDDASFIESFSTI